MKCPHCLEHFHSTWEDFTLIKDEGQIWGASATKCAACNRAVIALGKMVQGVNPKNGAKGWFIAPEDRRVVYPKSYSRSPLPVEVPEDFSNDYREACLVLPDSEKASAALSRRCLQHILREKAGVNKSNLADEIQQVIDSQKLPSHLAEDLDSIRNIGNFAAHPLKTKSTGEIVDVEPQEAEWQLNLLEQIFDFYFVQPARSKAKRDALNDKLHSLGKPPMKTT